MVSPKKEALIRAQTAKDVYEKHQKNPETV
jgi:hypothetical protein